MRHDRDGTEKARHIWQGFFCGIGTWPEKVANFDTPENP
jgi:hypothetical protein